MTLFLGGAVFLRNLQMKKELLKYIICPECNEKLKLIEYNNDTLQGLLSCLSGHYYPIFNGVPVLIKNEILLDLLDVNEAKKFINTCRDLGVRFNNGSLLYKEAIFLKKSYINWSIQWNTYKMEGTVWELKKTFLEHIPLDMTEIDRFKTILEIGCGNGRDIQHLIGDNKLIFGIDISNSVYYAHKRYEKQNNVFFLRSDVNCLPFNEDFFDFIYSDHCLHHIHNLEGCFNEIKRVLQSDNVFIFNLYGKEDNIIMVKFIEPLKNLILKRLPISLVHIISSIPAITLWLTLRLIYAPMHKYLNSLYRMLPLSEHMTFWFGFNYNTLKLTSFDILHAPIAHYFSSKDIDQLCSKTILNLEKKYRLRQTLWICKGKFRK